MIDGESPLPVAVAAHVIGWLMFQGPDGEPLSSVRFENLRDGFEDAELLKQLEANGNATEAKRISQQMAGATQDYVSDLRAFESAHEALLTALETTNKKK